VDESSGGEQREVTEGRCREFHAHLCGADESGIASWSGNRWTHE